MSADPSGPSDPTMPPSPQIAPEELAQLLAAGMPPGALPGAGGIRKKLLVAVLIAAIGVGASIMSCVGQSFSLRQARAQEGIEQQLKEIRASCSVGPARAPSESTR